MCNSSSLALRSSFDNTHEKLAKCTLTVSRNILGMDNMEGKLKLTVKVEFESEATYDTYSALIAVVAGAIRSCGVPIEPNSLVVETKQHE